MGRDRAGWTGLGLGLSNLSLSEQIEEFRLGQFSFMGGPILYILVYIFFIKTCLLLLATRTLVAGSGCSRWKILAN